MTEYVRREDALDRIEVLRKLARAGQADPQQGTYTYWSAYEDALLDLLDAFHGFCHTDMRIETHHFD